MKCRLLVVLLFCSAAWSQAQPAVDSNRLFIPKNFIWGWTQFDVAPPHNEPDPNLCAANAGTRISTAACRRKVVRKNGVSRRQRKPMRCSPIEGALEMHSGIDLPARRNYNPHAE